MAKKNGQWIYYKNLFVENYKLPFTFGRHDKTINYEQDYFILINRHRNKYGGLQTRRI